MLIESKDIQEERKFVNALKSKDVKAYNIFYRHYAAALNGIIYGIVNDKKLREKILKDLLVDIWNDIDTYKSENQRLFTWMVKKARLRASCAKLEHKINENQKTDNTYSPVFNMKGKIEDLGTAQESSNITQKEMKIFNVIYYKGMTAQKVANDQSTDVVDVRRVVRKVLTIARNTYKVK